MPEIPEYMLTKGRFPTQNFARNEMLYRRVPQSDWGADGPWATAAEIALDTFDFPDMSVTRERFGPPSAARWIGDNYSDWGIIGFRVRDLPQGIPYAGAYRYRMRPRHVPLKRNYPHSEVWVFERTLLSFLRGRHVDEAYFKTISDEVKQLWRARLRRVCSVVLQPGEPERHAESIND